MWEELSSVRLYLKVVDEVGFGARLDKHGLVNGGSGGGLIRPDMEIRDDRGKSINESEAITCIVDQN